MHESASACPKCGVAQKSVIQVGSKNTKLGFLALSLQPLRKYADFKGRAGRTEYWGFVLLWIIASFILGFVGALIHANWLADLLSLAIVIPYLAVFVRRMHDINRRGWWILLPIVNLVFACLSSQPEPNRFGEPPAA